MESGICKAYSTSQTTRDVFFMCRAAFGTCFGQGVRLANLFDLPLESSRTCFQYISF